MSTSDKFILNPPKAFLTDVFGTVVDWRSTVEEHLAAKAHETLNSASASIPSSVRLMVDRVSWPEFTQKWRTSYYEYTRGFDPDTMEFKTIDQHHLEALYKLMQEYQIEGLWTDDEISDMALVWHKLKPWPDSAPGLERLSQKFITATLGNGNRELLQDLSAHGNLAYTQIISAEDFKAYKPNPRVYQGAVNALPDVKPSECCLVAAHLNDLQAANSCGYKTVYIERAQEEQWPPERIEQAKKEGWVDLWITIDEKGFETLADKLDS